MTCKSGRVNTSRRCLRLRARPSVMGAVETLCCIAMYTTVCMDYTRRNSCVPASARGVGRLVSATKGLIVAESPWNTTLNQDWKRSELDSRTAALAEVRRTTS